jgi:abhydrolase domain-containing protein 12
VHAEDDQDIPVWHAQMLFDAFLEEHLPPVPEITPEMVNDSAEEEGKSLGTLLQERAVRRAELVTAHQMERMGRVEVFSKDRPHGKVAYLQTWWGAHDVGLVEGVQDYMADMFSMG